MRIAIVIERLDPSRGGRERSTVEIARTLSAQGCDVTILCQKSALVDASIRVKCLGSQTGHRVTRLREFVSAVHRTIVADRYDIVHAMLPIPHADVYQIRSGTLPELRSAALRRRSLLGRAGAILAWHLNSYRNYLMTLEREVIRDRSTMCLPVSQAVAVEVARYYGRVERVNVVYNGVDCSRPDDWESMRQTRRRKLGLGDDEFMMLLPANDFQRKGVRDTLVAYSQWKNSLGRNRRATLVVIGRQRTLQYQKLALRLGCAADTVFAAYDQDLTEWFSATDACLLLSWYDPCSRVILESVRLAVPSVTTLMNGASEILNEGAGIVVPAPDYVDDVVAAIERLSCPAERAAIGEKCRLLRDQLSIEAHVARLQGVYQRIIHDRKIRQCQAVSALNAA